MAPASGGSGGVVTPCGAALGTRPKGAAAADAPPKTRYHNGQVVSNRGEKYITEKVRARAVRF